MKLELKNLAPYLPYGLSIKILNYKCDYVGIEQATVNGFYLLHDGLYVTYKGGSTGKGINDFKPILRPLIDLYKTDGFSVSKLITHGYHNEFWHTNNFSVNHVYYHDLLILLEHHFDVFGLIDQGLAIDINTLGK